MKKEWKEKIIDTLFVKEGEEENEMQKAIFIITVMIIIYLILICIY